MQFEFITDPLFITTPIFI